MKQAKEKRLKFIPEKYEPRWLQRMDKRAAVTQRLSLLYQQVLADLGGCRVLSHVRVAMVERWVFQIAILERLEAQMAEDPKLASELLGTYTQSCNAMIGLAKSIGLDKCKAALPTLEAHLESKRA